MESSAILTESEPSSKRKAPVSNGKEFTLEMLTSMASTATLLPEVCDGRQTLASLIWDESVMAASVSSSNIPSTTSIAFSIATASEIAESLLSHTTHHGIQLPKSPYVFGLVAACVSFVYGYNYGIIAAALISIEEAWQPQLEDEKTVMLTMIVSSWLAGAVVGSMALATGRWLDELGRLKSMILACVLFTVGAIACSYSTSPAALIASRFIVGLATAIGYILPGLYITEMSPASVRGNLGLINQCAGYLGVAVSYVAGYFIYEAFEIKSHSHVGMFKSCAWLSAIALVAVLFCLPESPRWLISKGRDRDALISLRSIYGAQNAVHFTEEFAAIYARLSQTSSTPTARALASASLRQSAVTAVLLQVFQTAAGSGFFTFYSAKLFESWGYEGSDALLAAAVSVLPQMLVFLLISWKSEVWGRRRLLMASEFCMAIVMMALAVLTVSPVHAFLLFMAIALHRMAFALGLAPIPSVLVAEILPFAYRSRGLAASTALNWLLSFLISTALGLLIESPAIMSAVFVAMAMAAIAGYWWVQTCVPETRGLHLESVDTAHLMPVLPADPRERARVSRMNSLLAADSRPLRPPPIPAAKPQ